MKALTDFLTTDYGLMSAVVIAFCLLGVGFFVNFVRKHIAEDTARAAAGQIRPRTSH
ncbi:DUF3149 domain-containing protein [Derxia gummosa]|uniref:DUF3149 domain-containing protein n=1 Tax=Derxia gummosa DSM 723 TaxID=1121388 RepID=A0A8B6XBE5_9BURK|nr:DUF3149 domain-containing protein [Derxia gummosa]